MNTDLTVYSQTLFTLINTPLFKLGTQPVNLLWLLKFLLLFSVVILTTQWSKQILKRRILVSLVTNEGDRNIIANTASFTLAIIGILLIMQAMGLKLESLAIVVGGLGVGIGFGLQGLTKSLVSGLVLLGERKFRVGDLIDFKNTEGYIQDISLRFTVLKTFRGSELIIPNTQLTDSPIEKWHFQNLFGRIDIPLMIEHNSDLVLVTEVLLRAACSEAMVLAEPAPKVVFKAFGESGLHFELWVWVDHIDQRTSIKSALNFLIEYQFRLHHIKMAYRPVDPWLACNQVSSPVETPSVGLPLVSDSQTIMPTPPLRDLLLAMCYFQDFDEIEIRKLIEMGSRKNLNAGELLVKQGEFHSAFCIVLAGEIDAIYENDKISQRLFTFQSGEFFGELPLLLNIPYPTAMRAVGDVSLFLIDGSKFKDLLDRYPKLSDYVTDEMAKRQDYIQLCQPTLRDMDLLTDEQVSNPVVWLRDRLMKLWGNTVKNNG